MSEKKKEEPQSEQDETLTTEELEQAAGGIVFQDGMAQKLNTLNNTVKVPTIGAPGLPGTGGTVL
jgi:hypothetical protein